MTSRREEERNEKIIRGLMKLPPNRKCINCNSLGPQYVCTNFWTFVCITCSGIHREFTHRVKSVSMAKFTSQEVEALQRGGNQRAKEMFLKDWDLQRQRLPDSGNVDRVREFIKNVYVDKKYAGGKTSDKPPRDMQSLRNHEDDTRRASSYHSYSQSPPYEYQYEDRKYGKQGGVLSRKPGSDRGYYEGKISSFVYSPGRLGEHMYEDRFANEGSGSRVSDYSMSSTGDPFRSDTQSPNFQDKFSSPPINPVRDILVEDTRHQTKGAYSEANAKREADGISHTQRTASLGSFGSFDSNSMSLKSVNSGSLADVVSEPEQSVGTQLDGVSPVPLVSQASVSANAVGLDLFSLPVAQQPATSLAPSTDFFKPLANSSAPSIDLFKPPETSSVPTIDLFADFTHQHSAVNSLVEKSLTVPFPENEGWATFDLPQHEAATLETKNAHPSSIVPGDAVPFRNFSVLSSINASTQQPLVNSTARGPFMSVDTQCHVNLREVQPFMGPTSTGPWNAFEDALGSLPGGSFENVPHKSEPPFVANYPPTADQHLGSKVSEGEMPSHATDRKSINPFDLPYDSDLEPSRMFLNMSSLQAALPDPQLPPAFIGGLTQPWFPQNTVTSFVPATPQGGLAYMAGEGPTTQLSNITSQGPVASLGGNPFA